MFAAFSINESLLHISYNSSSCHNVLLLLSLSGVTNLSLLLGVCAACMLSYKMSPDEVVPERIRAMDLGHAEAYIMWGTCCWGTVPPILVVQFVCLFASCYKTKQSILHLPPLEGCLFVCSLVENPKILSSPPVFLFVCLLL